MSSTQPTLLCHYRYDPLDRLINQNQPDQPAQQRFYCKSRLATEIQGAIQHSIIQHGDQLLAQRHRQGDVVDTTLLATDLQRSVLQTLKANQRQSIAYSPYGHRPAENGLLSLLGFNGERRDLVTGCYLLGNGYRAFNPVLMRFNSPDSWSPFGKGGLNPYTYCKGDSINFSDQNGHFPSLRYLPPAFRKLALARIDDHNDLISLNSLQRIDPYLNTFGPSTTSHYDLGVPGYWREATTINGRFSPIREIYHTPSYTRDGNLPDPMIIYNNNPSLRELAFNKTPGNMLKDLFNAYDLEKISTEVDHQNLSNYKAFYMRQRRRNGSYTYEDRADAMDRTVVDFQVDRWAMKGKLNGVRPNVVADKIRERWPHLYK